MKIQIIIPLSYSYLMILGIIRGVWFYYMKSEAMRKVMKAATQARRMV